MGFVNTALWLDMGFTEIYNELCAERSEGMQKDRLYISTIASDSGKIAKEHGLGLEIAEYCTAYNMDMYFEQTDKAVRDTVSGVKNLTFHGPFNELFPCAIDPKARELAMERFLQAASLAEKYGAKKIVFHSGYTDYFYYKVWFIEQSVTFWQQFMERAPKNMTVCLENVREDEPSIMLKVLEQVGHERFKMCLDIGHAAAFSQKDAEYWLEKCQKYIDHFHIHNNDGVHDSHSELFCGKTDIVSFLQRAQQMCPKATFALEIMESKESVSWLINNGILEE